MQSIPLAVLKLHFLTFHGWNVNLLHAIHTACGIETLSRFVQLLPDSPLHAIHTACGIETNMNVVIIAVLGELHAIHTACGVEKGQVCAENP